MWLVISYDIPSPDSAIYRKIRKIMLKSGFSFPQKSLGWKWIPSAERAEAIRKKICSETGSSGHLIFWNLPDQVFANGYCRENGVESNMPDIPPPWIIV